LIDHYWTDEATRPRLVAHM